MADRMTWIRSISWLFVVSIFLSTFQVTFAGFSSDDSSWFSFMVNVMAEEENEDPETEETVKDAEWLVPSDLAFVCEFAERQDCYRAADPYISFIGEVSSPPPEA